MTLSAAARVLEAELLGEDVTFKGCSTDSRSVRTGELFIALPGERYDGHDFIGSARASGAVAAMVESSANQPLPLIVVKDSRIYMGKLAEFWRDRFNIPMVAVTGSNGKTTVKELISSILSTVGPTVSTSGNFNNDIGVPLTLFRLDECHGFAVIEIGANHPGEISELSRIVKPDVAAITQCAPAHLEGFGSLEGVARAKSEIYEGVPEGGTVIINSDDKFAEFWTSGTIHRRQIFFGIENNADVSATNIQIDVVNNRSAFSLVTPAGVANVLLPLPGRHNIMNALCAAATCTALNIDLQAIVSGLAKVQVPKGRMQVRKGIHGSCIIDDTYNANPASLSAAITATVARPGRPWLVLGDMGELGIESGQLHFQAGEAARESGIEKLFTLGNLSRESVKGFGNGARHFDDVSELVTCLKSELEDDVSLLVKGSRAMAMEKVVEKLQEAD